MDLFPWNHIIYMIISVFKGMTGHSVWLLILQTQKYFIKQHFNAFSLPDSSHQLLETCQGCSLGAHSHSGAGMQLFVWFCRMYTLGIWVASWRKWVTCFHFSGCYSYPVRRQVGREGKNHKRRIQEKRWRWVGEWGVWGIWNDNQWSLNGKWSFAGTT